MVLLPLTVDQREIFGVLVKILFRRHQWLKRVAEEPVGKLHLAAVFLVEPAPAGVHAVSGAPIAVETLEGERLTVFEHGNLAVVDRANCQSRGFRNAAHPGREPSATQMVFQQPVHAIHVPAQRPAGNDQTVANGANDVSLVAEDVEIDCQAQFL